MYIPCYFLTSVPVLLFFPTWKESPVFLPPSPVFYLRIAFFHPLREQSFNSLGVVETLDYVINTLEPLPRKIHIIPKFAHDTGFNPELKPSSTKIFSRKSTLTPYMISLFHILLHMCIFLSSHVPCDIIITYLVSSPLILQALEGGDCLTHLCIPSTQRSTLKLSPKN